MTKNQCSPGPGVGPDKAPPPAGSDPAGGGACKRSRGEGPAGGGAWYPCRGEGPGGPGKSSRFLIFGGWTFPKGFREYQPDWSSLVIYWYFWFQGVKFVFFKPCWWIALCHLTHCVLINRKIPHVFSRLDLFDRTNYKTGFYNLTTKILKISRFSIFYLILTKRRF